jgi:hypothetical protein
MFEWMLIGIFYANDNSHEVMERFSSRQECFMAKELLTRRGWGTSGMMNGKCIKVKRRDRDGSR